MSLRHKEIDQITTIEATLKILDLKEIRQIEENDLTQKCESKPNASVINIGIRFSSIFKISIGVQAADQSNGTKGEVAHTNNPNDWAIALDIPWFGPAEVDIEPLFKITDDPKPKPLESNKTSLPENNFTPIVKW